MTAGRPHKKKPVIKNCKRCGKSFNGLDVEELCPGCRNTLPKCAGCHVIMASEYGYLYGFARKVGKYKICTSCDVELRKNGFLYISETQYLLPSGQVKIKSIPEEDKLEENMV